MATIQELDARIAEINEDIRSFEASGYDAPRNSAKRLRDLSNQRATLLASDAELQEQRAAAEATMAEASRGGTSNAAATLRLIKDEQLNRGIVDTALTSQFGITDPDMVKYLSMYSMPYANPDGGNRGHGGLSEKTAAKFSAMGGQAELDRITAKIASDPTLQSQLQAVTAAGNKGDAFSRLGDAFVSAVPTVLKLAVLAAGVDLVVGGTLIAAGGSGATAAGATGAAEATATASVAGESGLALGYGEVGTAVTGATSTGGAFVGTSGALGATGNAVIDGALNSAMSSVTKNAAVNILTGQDPFANAGNAALGGAAFGGVSAAIPDNLNITGNALVDSSLSGAANSALPAGAAALATGGDVGNALIGGGLIGAGTPLLNAGVNAITPMATDAINAVVPDAINSNILDSTVNDVIGDTAQGALVGGVSAGVGGGDITNGMVVGGLGGLGGNLAGQAVDYLSNGSMGTGTLGNTLAQTAGTVAGQVIGNDLAPSGVPVPAASPVYTNFVQPGTMSSVDSMIDPNYTGGLINNYQSLAVQRANQARA